MKNTRSNIGYEAPRIVFIENVADHCFCASSVESESPESYVPGEQLIIF